MINRFHFTSLIGCEAICRIVWLILFSIIWDHRLNLKTRKEMNGHQRVCSVPFLRGDPSIVIEEELPLFSFVDSWPSTKKRHSQPLIFWFSCFVSKRFPEHVRMLFIETAKEEEISHTLISFGLTGLLCWSTVVRRRTTRSFSFSGCSWIGHIVIIRFVQHEHFRSLN